MGRAINPVRRCSLYGATTMPTLRQSPFDLFERLEQQIATAERVPNAEIIESESGYVVRLELSLPPQPQPRGAHRQLPRRHPRDHGWKGGEPHQRLCGTGRLKDAFKSRQTEHDERTPAPATAGVFVAT